MRDEKELLLSVATPEEWDCFLSGVAYGFYTSIGCPFCAAYKGNCCECIPSTPMFRTPCLIAVPPNVFIELPTRIDNAIARLERAGIWDEGNKESR